MQETKHTVRHVADRQLLWWDGMEEKPKDLDRILNQCWRWSRREDPRGIARIRDQYLKSGDA